MIELAPRVATVPKSVATPPLVVATMLTGADFELELVIQRNVSVMPGYAGAAYDCNH